MAGLLVISHCETRNLESVQGRYGKGGTAVPTATSLLCTCTIQFAEPAARPYGLAQGMRPLHWC